MRFLIGQRETHDDILTTDLPPKPIHLSHLRHGAAQAFDPDKVPFRHGATLRSESRVKPDPVPCNGGLGYPDCHM